MKEQQVSADYLKVGWVQWQHHAVCETIGAGLMPWPIFVRFLFEQLDLLLRRQVVYAAIVLNRISCAAKFRFVLGEIETGL